MQKEFIKYIDKHDKIAIFHHVNIDGDSLSSSYGLLLAIKQKYPNKEVKWVVNEEEMAKNFGWFPYNKEYVAKEIDSSYLAIIGDTSVSKRINGYDEFLKTETRICFDHHLIIEEDLKFDLHWRDGSYPASSIQAVLIAEELGIKLNEETSFALMIGILTDTGNFKYSLANSEPVYKFASLIDNISNEKMDWFWNTFHKKTIRQIEVQKHFYNNMKFDRKVSYVYFDEKTLEEFSDINFKIMIHSIGNIENYPIWAIFSEVRDEDGKLRVKGSLRSNGPIVADVAKNYGGGGHARAAGMSYMVGEKTLQNVLDDLNNLDFN